MGSFQSPHEDVYTFHHNKAMVDRLVTPERAATSRVREGSRAQPPELAPQIWGRVWGEKARKEVSVCVFVSMTFHA